MKYMGSKRRIWKYIAPFILGNRKEGQCYVEPFCGGCNSLCNVNGWRLAADINPYLIALFKGLLSDEKVVFDIDKEYYDQVRQSYRNKDNRFSDFEKGWVGFMASYNGRFFDGGYSGNGVKGKNGEIRDYINESMLDIIEQIDKLRGVDFRCCSYDELDIPQNSIIYCDPPYRDTKKYDRIQFDYNKFYDWLKLMKDRGHSVFISEYWMPEDFDCIWEKEVKCNINIDKNLRTERLFTL